MIHYDIFWERLLIMYVKVYNPDKLLRYSLPLIALLTGACSTIAEGTHQTVALSTPGLDNATCQVLRGSKVLATVSTPATVRLSKGRQQVQIACITPAGASITRTMVSRYSPCSRIQAPVGYLVDGASGAMWRYPEKVEITANDTTLAKDNTECHLSSRRAKSAATGDASTTGPSTVASPPVRQ